MSNNDILNSWILIEQLSEGDLNLKKKDTNAAYPFDPSKADKHGMYNYLKWRLDNKFSNTKSKRKSNPGVIFYFDVVEFKRVIDVIVAKYHLSNLQDEINTKQKKFGVSIAFDENLNLLEDQIFVTMGSYVLHEKRLINDQEKFKKYEKDIKDEILELFNFQNSEENQANLELKFNQAFHRLMGKFSAEKNNTYWSIVKNIDSDDINLHSFFIEDLEWGKEVDSEKLRLYLNGENPNNKINLDPTVDSTTFSKILQPKNYPLGHFFTKFPASLMQQVAINLAINAPNDIRTVNGPPGTGKTTLLKDIFADLLVKQAKEICDLDKKNLYSKTDSQVGQTKLPDNIADKDIVVASSNNGAVKNIVDELPQTPDVGESFKEVVDGLLNINYFKDIANANLKDERYWGLFSLEGGRKDNMNKIVTRLQQMVDELKAEDYDDDPDAYDDFYKQYKKVKNRQRELQHISNSLTKSANLADDFKRCQFQLNANGEAFSPVLQQLIKELNQQIANDQTSFQQYQALLPKRRGLLEKLLGEDEETKALRQKVQGLREKISKEIKQKDNLQKNELYLASEFENFNHQMQAIPSDVKLPDFSRNFSERSNYDQLEEENYWFNENDLKEESKLFIAALRVRKQFMHENYKSLQAAIYNWQAQDKKVKENQEEITLRSWQWINFAIPVISTTFASFHRMFRNLSADSIANLFIDEAGQAVPQAVVGPLLRSKKVMAVGDPAQIKPVNTLDSKIVSLIGDRIFKVSEKYVSADASVQTLLDQASQYGYYKNSDQTQWIGIPLWVHRRCLDPMFSISNAISYNDKMVLPKMIKDEEVKATSKDDLKKLKLGFGKWINVKSETSNDKFVQEQADTLKAYINKLTEEDRYPFTKDDIFVITPFKNVANKLSRYLKGFTKYENGKPSNIGTVHTFQGKENKVVFLVLGASPKEKAAAMWAVNEPNIINVAATRAKKWFFIIGDKGLYSSLKTPTIDKTIKAIDDYEKNILSKLE